ncbi:NINE protein [Agrococcus sediminis]|uniref:NINE protein n=1 Tax=Agrococcus sediminis TaxID=2599924 RepID=UPI0034268F8F
MTHATPSAPGWYDDPQGRRRWWDGDRWGAFAPWGEGGELQRSSKPRPVLDARLTRDTTVSPVVVHHVVHAPAKELAVAYLLLLFLGTLGAHRFYLGRTGSAIGMLALTLFGVMLTLVLIGFVLLFAVAIWWFVDLFLTPGMVREENQRATMARNPTGYYRGWPQV